ncbi:transcription initiation at TATA-containing promoter protein [Cladophialophora chaetospira]|uniref:Transcription initiation at TATA-containing promoter protein n=1 Tax=Cladophialophora chaetospira TaxID=386627 RepID=A0AA38XJL6_9EURO|nr:transcription initiation at TATA-containing promoter protein [Cladophialophora chaetospira]
MDVEMQMEASGVPTQFGTTSDQPEGNHVADNITASILNSEATVTTAPPKQLPDDAPTSDAVETLQEALVEAETVPEKVPSPAPATNGFTSQGSESAQIPTSTVPDSQPQLSLDNISTAPLPSTSISDSNLNDSFIPSSIPAEIQSSATPLETSQSTMDISEPQPPPVEAPISDLRTEPHSDALPPEAVAQIEAQKHELDNSADLPQAPKDDISTTSIPAPTPIDVPSKIGLPSPPTLSPPPAPQPAPAVLPEQTRTIEPATTIVALPPEEPRDPAPTPAVPPPSESVDEIMTDAPVLASKQVHDREDDDDGEPSAKRVRTEEPQPSAEESQFKVPEVPAASSPAVANGDTTASGIVPEDGDDSVTPPRLAHMKKVISNLKKSNASANFRLPVDYVALKIPNYPLVITQPMDLGTIDNHLKRNEYNSISAFVADFELIINNCVKFNGPEHGVSQQAKKMKSSFDSQMKNLPKASIEEPSKEVKKAARKSEPTRTAPPRRPSVSTSTVNVASAGSPASAAPSTPAFALNPDGMPLIRRDSTMADGRPKRAIVPTKRNSEFGAGRPRKKKYETELKFCEEILKDIMSLKHWQANQYFMDPVDPVALNIPTYFQIIKKPMDLKTVKQKLASNEYEKAKDFEDDVRQIVKNCFKFNPEGDMVNAAGHLLEDLFNQKWATKDEWISARAPASVTPSDAEDDEDDEEEESEDEGNESEEDRSDQIKKLQEQIAALSQKASELTQKSKKSKSPKAGKKKDKAKVKKEKSEVTAPKTSKDKKDTKKKSNKKPEKERFVTFAEKQYISNGIAMLPEKQMQEALRIIQQSVPSLANSDQSEIELDIEEVPNSALLKLLGFVKKYAGPPPDEPKAEPSETYHAAAPTKSRKSKPMSKVEQEAQIEELKGKLGAYSGPISPNAVPSIENEDSSDDEDSGEESEEE